MTLAALGPAASAAPQSSAGDNSSFKPVENQNETQSGEALVIEAYAVIWVALMVFIVIAWRRTRTLEDKVQTLEKAVEKAVAAATPSTKRSVAKADEPE